MQQNILLVQHNPKERRDMTGVMQRNGLSVVAIDSATQTLSLLEQEDYGIIIIIDHLEEMPGQELCSLIKSHWPAKKVLIVSKEYNEQDREINMEAGADGFFPNTNDRNLIIKAVQNLNMQLQRSSGQ